MILAKNGVRANQAAGIIRDKFPGIYTQPVDIHRIRQSMKEKKQSFSDVGLANSEIQELITEINNQHDAYRIKYKGDTQVMDCLLYWNPEDIQLSRRFCQVCTLSLLLKLGTPN